jgi:deazaflavin-dependent oxidoreductase (nitroreductase family)
VRWTVEDRNEYNAKIIKEFRSNGGVAGGGAMPLILLRTIGARTGRERTNPLASLAGEDGVLYVFATKGGASSHPDWYRNLVANPRVVVELGTESYDAIATPITGAERDLIYARQVEQVPGFGEFESKTERIIPVVELRRV